MTTSPDEPHLTIGAHLRQLRDLAARIEAAKRAGPEVASTAELAALGLQLARSFHRLDQRLADGQVPMPERWAQALPIKIGNVMRACLVFTKNLRIRGWLLAHDPQALSQARYALAIAGFDPDPAVVVDDASAQAAAPELIGHTAPDLGARPATSLICPHCQGAGAVTGRICVLCVGSGWVFPHEVD